MKTNIANNLTDNMGKYIAIASHYSRSTHETASYYVGPINTLDEAMDIVLDEDAIKGYVAENDLEWVEFLIPIEVARLAKEWIESLPLNDAACIMEFHPITGFGLEDAQLEAGIAPGIEIVIKINSDDAFDGTKLTKGFIRTPNWQYKATRSYTRMASIEPVEYAI